MNQAVINTNAIVEDMKREGEKLASAKTYDDLWDHEDQPCPECGSYNLYSMPRMSSPDDFTKQTECRACGSTWED